MKLLLTSDTHYGMRKIKTARILDKFIKAIKDAQPDVVCHAGDWASTSQNHLSKGFKQFRNILGDKMPIVGVMGNHDCLDEQTECFTKRGWLKYTELNKTDEVLGINENGQSEWQNIQNIIIRSHYGNIHKIEKRSLELFCTPNHRILHKRRSMKDDVYCWSDYQLKQFSELDSRIEIPVSGINWPGKSILSDEIIELAGLMVTDCNIGKTITFYQRKSNADFVRNILNRNKIEFYELERDRDIKVICGKELKKRVEIGIEFHLKREESEALINKTQIYSRKTLPVWIWQLSDRQFELFLKVLIEADGTKHSDKESAVLYKPIDFLDELQGVCAVHGYHTSIHAYREHHRLNICKRSGLQIDNVKNESEVIDYNGEVWCLTVKNSNFLIRRNGKCHYTGNCWNGDKVPYDSLIDLILDAKTLRKNHNITDHFAKDNVEIFGYDGWYKTPFPPSNDAFWMPKKPFNYDEEMHQYLIEQATLNCEEVCKKLRASIAKHKVVVTHFESVGIYRGNPAYDGMKGSMVDHQKLIEAGATLICYGHSHRASDFFENNVRIVNCGSDYDRPKFIMIELT